MKTSEAFWMFLPVGLEELFEMVRLERTDQAYDIWLDDKNSSQKKPRATRILLRVAAPNMW